MITDSSPNITSHIPLVVINLRKKRALYNASFFNHLLNSSFAEFTTGPHGVCENKTPLDGEGVFDTYRSYFPARNVNPSGGLEFHSCTTFTPCGSRLVLEVTNVIFDYWRQEYKQSLEIANCMVFTGSTKVLYESSTHTTIKNGIDLSKLNVAL